jgi:aldose 1-epimerase
MYLRDAEGIPTGQRVAPGAGPYDDCFTGMSRPPTLTWPGALRLSLTSSCDHWVVYDQPEHALCVEPQSGPPDAFSLCPRVVEPGEPLIERFSLEWQEIREPRS